MQSDKPTLDDVTGEGAVQAGVTLPVAGADEAQAGADKMPLAVLPELPPQSLSRLASPVPAQLTSTPAQLPQWRSTLAQIQLVPEPRVVREPAIAAEAEAEAVALVEPVVVPVADAVVEPLPEPSVEQVATVAPGRVIPGLAVSGLAIPGLAIPGEPRSQAGIDAPSVPARSWPRAVWQTSVRVVRWGVIAGFVWLISMLGVIGALRFVDPPGSMLMAMQRLGGQEIEHTWVPLDQVSQTVRRAVMVAEDGKFCQHQGFDFGEIRAAMRAGDGFGRGASTITQQVAKNMFLWPGKSYVRKALEVPLTVAIEAMWTKPRILEVYLNIAEWGPGLFGIEAAAQSYFGRAASQVSEKQAALLAVVLPNPIKRDVSDPSPAVLRRAATIQARMRVTGGLGCGLE